MPPRMVQPFRRPVRAKLRPRGKKARSTSWFVRRANCSFVMLATTAPPPSLRLVVVLLQHQADCHSITVSPRRAVPGGSAPQHTMERRRCAKKAGGAQKPQWSNRRPLIEIERQGARETDEGGFIRSHQDEQARKRPRVEEPVADDGWEFDPDHLPTDAEVALDFLKPRQPPSLVLVSHVPGVLKDRGKAERERREACTRGARSRTSSSPRHRQTSPCSMATSTAPC